MSEAPERIWAWWDDEYDTGLINTHGDKRYTPEDAREYVRADRIAELEAKLAKAVEELQFDYDTLGEINPSNYNHDDVCNLNDKSVEVILSIKATLAELTGGKDE